MDTSRERPTPLTPHVLTRRTVLAACLSAAALPLVRPHPAAGSTFTPVPQAWELFQQAAVLFKRYTAVAYVEAQALLRQALVLDPLFARATALLGATYRHMGNQAWTADRDAAEREATRLVGYGVHLAWQEPPPQPSVPYALEQLGWVHLYITHDHDAALSAAEHAVQHDPTFLAGYALGAHVLTYMAQPEDSLALTAQLVARDPQGGFYHDYHRGNAYYVLGFLCEVSDPPGSIHAYHEAEHFLRATLHRLPQYRPAHSYLAATYMALERASEAAAEMQWLKTNGRPQASDNPAAWETYMRRGNPYRDPRITETLMARWKAAEQGGNTA